jgi:hypothetical protein
MPPKLNEKLPNLEQKPPNVTLIKFSITFHIDILVIIPNRSWSARFREEAARDAMRSLAFYLGKTELPLEKTNLAR